IVLLFSCTFAWSFLAFASFKSLLSFSKNASLIFSNTDQLMAFYYEKQAQFRNNDVTFDELDYINATKELELTKIFKIKLSN
ncbi:hypothetical protein, partial [Mycoplasmopsis bovis]|uniref:hypothetical protein n=1 Tax=Mycoplasmopsis bovis TaxID=28903 RepID=UPI003D2AA82E